MEGFLWKIDIGGMAFDEKKNWTSLRIYKIVLMLIIVYRNGAI